MAFQQNKVLHSSLEREKESPYAPFLEGYFLHNGQQKHWEGQELNAF